MQNRAKIALAAAVTAIAATAALWPTEAGLICEVVCGPDTTERPAPPLPAPTATTDDAASSGTDGDHTMTSTTDAASSGSAAGTSTGAACDQSTGPTGP